MRKWKRKNLYCQQKQRYYAKLEKEKFILDSENRSEKIIIEKIIIEKYKKLNKYSSTSNLTDQTHISSFLKDF